MLTVKELVQDGNKVRFTRYFNGDLWYEVWTKASPIGIESTGFEFPVPTADIGGATFLAEDKALLFMRYIRKHRDMLIKAKEELTDG